MALYCLHALLEMQNKESIWRILNKIPILSQGENNWRHLYDVLGEFKIISPFCFHLQARYLSLPFRDEQEERKNTQVSEAQNKL